MLTPQKIQDYLEKVNRQDLPVVDFLKRNIFIYSMWLVGIPAFIYGAVDRGLAAYTIRFSEVTTLSHCMVAIVALMSWFVIGMAMNIVNPVDTDLFVNPFKSNDESVVMRSLSKSNCVATQQYRLPFPYQCQIYHLLNLKHLEDIHRFSLGNLKVTDVSHFEETQTGGKMRFRTMLDSPMNVLRLWRDPSVEVTLILHTPRHIELKVPTYDQKHIQVLFKVLPLNADEHILSVQMFSDLPWPRVLIRAILIIAASLTLLEDLPYLSQLAAKSKRSPSLSAAPAAPGMQLFRRYMQLYGQPSLPGAIANHP